MKEVLGSYRAQTLKSKVITNLLTFVYIKLATKKKGKDAPILSIRLNSFYFDIH